MNSSDYWIGDKVKLRKSGKIGVYEGMGKDGKARIKVGQKFILSAFSNLEKYIPVKIEKSIDFESNIDRSIPAQEVDFEIDLHIEKLAPNLMHQIPPVILSKQIEACKMFIEQTIALRRYRCTIIHGLGTGQLKKEVQHLLNMYAAVNRSDLINNGGATEVIFEYR